MTLGENYFKLKILALEVFPFLTGNRPPGHDSNAFAPDCQLRHLLVARPLDGAREIAAAHGTPETERLTGRMISRCAAAEIELALVRRDGAIVWTPAD